MSGRLPARLWGLSVGAFVLRLAVALGTVDLGAEAYQEFGTIAAHVRAGHGYAYLTAPGVGPLPSAYVPPGYVAVLLPFLGVADVALRNVLLLGLQSAVGALCVPLAWTVGRAWYAGTPVERWAAWGAAAVMAVLPTLVYAAATYSATVFYHAGLLALFLWMARRPRAPGAAVGLGLLLAALVYVRTEALLLAALVLAWEARDGRLRTVALAATVLALALAPWVVRNAVVLGRPTLSTGAGLNLYRGNNPVGIGVWASDSVGAALAALPPGPRLEARRDRLYREAAWATVRAAPGRALARGAEKVRRLWIVDPDDARARHPLAVGSWALLVTLALVGLSGRPPPGAFWIALGQATAVAFVVFALSRHQVLLMAALVPVAGHGVARIAAALHPRPLDAR